MKCPKCGLINDEGVAHCDCGFNFATGVRDQAFVRRKRRWQTWSARKILLIIGSLVLVELIAVLFLGGAVLPGGLWLLVIVAWLLTYEDVRT